MNMELTKEEKDALIWLTKHPWFRVLEKIEEVARNKLWQLLLESNLKDPKVIDILEENKLYAQARKDFLLNAKKHTQEIYTPNI